MSPTADPPQPAPKSKKEKERERREKAAQQQATERLKAVVRRLPPNLPEDIFWEVVKQWVTDETATWKIYYPGKFKKRDNKENIPSRAYIAFKNEEQIARFSQGFDGHLFRDKAGNESFAVVEFAPYQKVPSEKRKPDNKNATIEKDEDYISFIQSLNAPTAAEPVTIDALLAANRPPSPPKTTPLLEALKAEKSAQRDKEAILRNHAHYKDQANITGIVGGGSSSRKEEKKKAAVAAQAAQAQAAKQAATAPATPSKKKKKDREAKEQAQAQKSATAGKAPAETKAPVNPSPAKQTRQKQAKAAPPPPPAAPVTIQAKAKPQPPATVKPAAEASSSNAATGTAAPAAAPPARRPRAVLGNRHFEAALAGVGAARPRREREKEAANNGPNVVPAAASGPSNGSATAAPASPVKGKGPALTPAQPRNRRGGAPSNGPAAPAPANNAKAPTILPRETNASGGSAQNVPGVIAAPANATAAPPPTADRGGRGSRRGRGRGAGGPRGGGRGG